MPTPERRRVEAKSGPPRSQTFYSGRATALPCLAVPSLPFSPITAVLPQFLLDRFPFLRPSEKA
jgi:hypothetical protein